MAIVTIIETNRTSPNTLVSSVISKSAVRFAQQPQETLLVRT